MKKTILIYVNKAGVGWWRGTSWVHTLQSSNAVPPERQIEILDFPTDPVCFKNAHRVIVQGFTNQSHRKYFDWLLELRSKAHLDMDIVFNLDDVPYELPEYHRSREHYLNPEVQESLRHMLTNSDWVLTTTKYLGNRLCEIYGVDRQKMVCLPNLIPIWWTGGYLDIDRRVETFNRRKTTGHKISVLITSSISHFSEDTAKPDDFTQLAEAITKTKAFVHWIFLGKVPKSVEALGLNEEQVQCHPNVPILEYPSLVRRLNPDFIVAPLLDNDLNRCKSNIKILEASCLGIPILCQNISTYSPYLPSSQLFSSSQELVERLRNAYSISHNTYRKMITRQMEFVQTPTREGDFHINGWILEHNIPLVQRVLLDRNPKRFYGIFKSDQVIIGK